MAKKRINKNDIAPKDVFGNITEGARSAKKQIDLLTQSVKVLKQNAKNIKKNMGGAKVGNTKGLKDFDQAQKRANQTAKAKLQIDKQLLHHKARLSQQQRDENKAIQDTIQAQTKLTTTQKKSLGTLQKIELHSRQLRAERKKLNLETREGSRRLREINRRLDQNNAKIRASGDAMKKQRLNVGNYSGAIGKLTGMLARLGLGFGVFTLLRNAFNVVKNFDQAQANLASVLGVTTDKMAGLTEQAKLLGKTTTFTASQVAELQLEFAKLGFTQEQIEGMAESTLMLAEATGTELGESATVVGATMRGFGLDVTETQRVVDVMANSFSKSSLDMSKFSTAMASVAPVAKLAGLTIEQTTALLGTLTDRGIEASTAGTGLRNMFLQANKHGLTFSQALEKVKNATNQMGVAMDLFGTRGATLGVVLANNQDQVEGLTKKLYLSDGAAKQMADTQRNTLGGSIKLLTSAWEGWILKQNEAGGASDKLRSIIEFLSDNIETILGWVMFAVKQFIIFKTAIVATKIGMIAFNGVMAISKISMMGFTKAMKTMDKGMKTNAIGLAITAIVWAISKMNDVMNEMNATNQRYIDVQEEISEISQTATEDIAQESAEIQLLVKEIKSHNAGSKERGELLQTMNEKYGTHLKNIEDETEANRLLNVELAKIISNMEIQIRLQAKKDEFTTIVKELQLAEEDLAKSQEKARKRYEGKSDAEIKRLFKRRGEMVKMTKEQKNFNLEQQREFLIQKSSGLKQSQLLLLVNKLKQDKLGIEKKLGVAIEKNKETETTFDEKDLGDGDPDPDTDPEKTISLVRKTEDARLEIIENARKRELKIRQKTFDRLKEDTEAKKTNQKEFDAWLIAQEDLLQHDLLAIEKKFKDKHQKELDDIQKAREKRDAEAIKKKQQAREKESEKIAKDLKKLNDLDDKRKINIAEIAVLNAELSGDEEEIIKAKIKLIETELAIKTALMKEGTVERIKAEKEAEKKIADLKKKGETEQIKETQEAIDHVTNYFIAQADKRIDKINEEIDAHKKQADVLSELAKNGNITAKESLAEENRLIAEAEQKKAEMEKRKQQIQMVSAILSAYTANLDAGQDSNTAFTNAITSKAVLDQFIAGIGSAYEGMEDTGKASNPLDSHGGRLMLLHNNERILTAKQNKKIGSYSNEEVARIVEQKRMGKLAENSQIGQGWDAHLVVDELLNVGKKLDAVNKTIENKEVNRVELGEITQTTMKIVESRKKAGNRTINTYKVKV